jgi:hypothetical protein
MKFVFDTEIIRGATFNKSIRYSYSLGQSSSSNTIATGSKTFGVQSGQTLVNGQRARASLAGPPQDDPTQFVEGAVTSYSGPSLVFTADTISGVAGALYNLWNLTAAVDLTGGSFDAKMVLSLGTCAGKNRSPVTLGVVVTVPTYGVFSLYLAPTATAILTLGTYDYLVLYTPASSSDKFPILSGTITVIDA